ncbi:TPA: ATP-binding protein [Candidatus Woesearchaeota archaeon]|nr:ATP-binding protein [Candidatus Woesearchaeota archaeon]
MYDVVIGRKESDVKKYGLLGTVLLGKHYVKMGHVTSLSNNVYLDVARSHVVFICGKRGGGKSYTMGAIAEGMADLPVHVRQNLSFILLDTMGIYWTMKYPNKRDEPLLAEWGFKPKALDVKIYTPKTYYKEYKEKGIPTDFPFSLNAGEFSPEDWQMTFEVLPTEPVGVLIERIIFELREKTTTFTIGDIIDALKKDTHTDQTTKDAAINRFLNAKLWGIFAEKGEKGTSINELARAGQVTVLDVSCYATMPGGWKIKSLIVGLVSQNLFVQRMLARKNEEYKSIKDAIHYFTEDAAKEKLDMPLVWLVIDEAHEFLPREGRNPATQPLITILREGRQPGISLIMATQQPGKIHTDVMTQSDTVLSHRITAKMDVDALSMLMQSYMREGLDTEINNLPREQGAGVLFDDTNERMYAIRVRPRFTWHGGESPFAIPPEKKLV